MVNDKKSPAPIKVILSDAELLALLNMSGLKLGKMSPLAQVSGKAAADANQKLQQMGLISGDNNLSLDCLECLKILANPSAETDLVWGNADGVSLSKVYSAGQDKLVSFTKTKDSNYLSFFLSMQDMTDLIVEKTVPSEIKDPADFSIETGPATLPMILALLDLYREGELQAVLDRRVEFEVKIEPGDVNRIIQEAKLEMNLGWYASTGNMAMPSDVVVTLTSINEGINALKRAGIIGADGVLSTRAVAFAYRAFPLISYVGIKSITLIEKTQIAFFRGLTTLLFAQLTSESGVDRALVRSISTSDLPQILFTFATKPLAPETPSTAASQEQPAPASVGINCPKCAAPNPANGKFCKKCGAPLAQPSKKFCPKCGDPVTAGEKFCNKCGTKLV